MAAKPAVLVTRPLGQQEALCAALGAAGFAAHHLPMLAVERSAELSVAQRQLIAQLAAYRHCIFISSNAARFGLQCLLEHWQQWPAGVRCYAVGNSTAMVLEAAGLTVATPGENMTSEGLLALPSLQALSAQRVLIVKGEGGRRALADALRARGAVVDELCCYRRIAPAQNADDLQRVLNGQHIRVILLSSGEGLANLAALLHPGENTKLAAITLVVPSPRIAEQARTLGWQDIVVAANATDSAMLAALQAWWSGQGENG